MANPAEQWALHSAQQDMLQAEVEQQPLIGPLEVGFEGLRGKLSGAAPGFLNGLKAIEKRGYKGMRTVRGDGNCFFRGFMFRLIEKLVVEKNEGERKRLAQFMKDSLDILVSAQYELIGVETFQELMVELFEDDIPRMSTTEDVVNLFSNKGESEHIVWYSRILCAAYLKLNADRFLPFLSEQYLTMEDFCSREVEPQGKECEQLQIIALSEILQISVSIEYLSSASTEESEPVVLGPESAAMMIHFIYRPGHYDVLYFKDS